MKILTGNSLRTGAVIWWTGQDWSIHVEDAAEMGDDAQTILDREEAERHVVSAYIIDAEKTADGRIRPAHIKERIRALGPTVRPDLTLRPADPDAGSWVI